MTYYWYVMPEKIQFCRIYEKFSQANLSKAEVQQILTELDRTEQDFATLLGASLATIRKWERGTGEPSGAAKTLLAVARLHPEVIREALADGRGVEIEFLSNSEIGIKDGSHEIVGTDFDPTNAKGNGAQLLPLWLSLGLRPNVGFESHTLVYQGKRLVIFEINPAFDRPVEFYGTAHIRVGTSKTTLANHSEKQRQLWMRRVDWSAAICEQASPADLDPEALQKARKEFLTKFPSQADEVADWDDITFLNKAKLAIQGRITHAALLLLGKPESATLLNPAVAMVNLNLIDTVGSPFQGLNG